MRGQLSLEYIILLAAFFSCLLFLVPAINNTVQAAKFGLDVRNAEHFIDDLKLGIERMNVLGDGSSLQISSNVINQWELKNENMKLILIVESSELGRGKKLEREVNANFSLLPFRAENEIRLKLEKNSGKVSVVNGEP
ncbi:MAG: hypothetical protein ABID38_01030 [Candidatus Diapherotrites archaeon]